MATNGDCVLFVNPHILSDWSRKNTGVGRIQAPHTIPANVVGQLESYQPIAETKRAKDLVAVDGVVCTRVPITNTPAVLLSKRGLGAFGGKYWGYGGTLGAYQDPITFLENCVEKECGVPFTAEVMIGVFRTCAPEIPQSTTNLCYAGYVSYEVIQKTQKRSAGHDEPVLFSLQDLAYLPSEDKHWFPLQVSRLALENMP